MRKTQPDDRYYVIANKNFLTIKQLAENLNISLKDVKSYLNEELPEIKRDDNINTMVGKRGNAVAWTGEASMAMDEIGKQSFLTRADINSAAAAGKYQLAADLVKSIFTGEHNPMAGIEARNGNIIGRC